MSDATPAPSRIDTRSQIDIGIEVLVDKCGYSPEAARAEILAFSHRHKAGLVPIGHALALMAQWSPDSAPIDAATPIDSATAFADATAARRHWQSILRSTQPRLLDQAA